MIRYNICFIRRGSQILLLNRERASWMGCWNGVGGKLEPGEIPRDSVMREMREETGIEPAELHFKGMITWSQNGAKAGGMYTYLAEVPEGFAYATPLKTDEGILDWKEIGWILHEDNVGVAANLPRTLPAILQDERAYDHHCMYHGEALIDYRAELLDPAVEWDAELRAAYLQRYKAPAGLRTGANSAAAGS